MNIRTRIERLESTRREPAQLALIAPYGVLTPAQQAQREAAERAGLDPLVIHILPRYGTAPTAGALA